MNIFKLLLGSAVIVVCGSLLLDIGHFIYTGWCLISLGAFGILGSPIILEGKLHG